MQQKILAVWLQCRHEYEEKKGKFDRYDSDDIFIIITLNDDILIIS